MKKISIKMQTVDAASHFIFLILILLCSHFVDYVHLDTDIPPLSEDQDVSIGCPIPDLRFVRPKKIGSTTTEQPYVTFETTQIYLPDDLTTADFEYMEHTVDESASTELDDHHTSNNNQRQTRYTDFNPYAWSSGDGEELHVPLGSADTASGHRNTNANAKWDRRKLRKNTGRRRLDQHNQGHKQNKREIREDDNDIYFIPSTDAANRLHDDLISIGTINRTMTILLNNNDLRKYKAVYDNEDDQLTTDNVYLHHANDDSNHSSWKMRTAKSNAALKQNEDSGGGGGKTTSNKYKIRDGNVANKIALQRTQNADESLNVSEINNNDNRSYEREDDDDYDNIADNTKQKNNAVVVDNDNDSENNGNIKWHEQNLREYSLSKSDADVNATNDDKASLNNKNRMHRVKRKSGKATGALSRPKGGSDSSSKSTSRKKDAGYDEEGLYVPHGPEEIEESEEEEEEESDETVHFDEITEVRFPGEVGPMGDRRLCKIRCVKGKWVGPLCASNEEDDHGQVKFQPLYKSCNVNRIPPHLLLSYRNISVNVGWDVPHGHSLQARCKDLGLYKLLGETRVLCSNGLWAPRMPSCVPTTLLTNFSDDSPPSIRIKLGMGSGAFEPSGVLAVLPSSTIHLDCMYPRRRGNPEWTWTGWHRTYYTGWSNVPEEKATKYRLTIKDIQQQESGTYTCASPRGLTNSIVIIVAMSTCQEHPSPVPPLTLRLEGLKLGQRALYTCPTGYTIDGISNSTCLASGNWSSPPPSCNPVQCPSLFLEDPHLSLTELNTSAWGRAVFKCSWGYRLSGPPGLECEPSGSWSGSVPRCRSIQCAQPLVPINGRIDGTSVSASHRKYAVGALITFSCNEGHLLVGEASIVCTETGFWSHPPPFCKSQCPYPGDPPNGLIAPLKFHYDPGDFLSVQCRPGFVEYGANGPPERPRCLPDGNWSGPVPQCRNYEEV